MISISKSISHFLQFSYVPLAKGAGLLIAGVICQIVFPPLSPPLFWAAGSMAAAGLAVKIGDHYHSSTVEELKFTAIRFQQKHPHLQLITFLFSLIVTPLVPVIGCLLGTLAGICTGVLIQAEHIKALHDAKRLQLKEEP